ncbi:MAG TPA: GNAT family N-acetyltransferase [Reyranella sp.]|nr:GNAT family N-acetyltransferase [Reyranella sp.]
MVDIRPLRESDVTEATRIIRLAFGTFLGAPDPEAFWSDLDYARGRFGAEHVKAFAAEDQGRLIGSNFATRWGSVGFFGPITIRPDIWDGGVGQRLVREACDAFDAWGVSHAGLFTFPHSAKHVWTYGKFGFHPRFLTPVMAIPAAATSAPRWLRYGELPQAQRADIEVSVRGLTEQLYPGLDLGGEIRTVFARKLGETLLLMDGDSRVVGFAVCHVGPGTEAGDGTLFVKFGAVMPGPEAERRFAALLDACIGFGAAVGMANVVAGVNTARDAAYRAMQKRGFRTQLQGVTMHRPNEPGYSRPGLFVLDDWR